MSKQGLTVAKISEARRLFAEHRVEPSDEMLAALQQFVAETPEMFAEYRKGPDLRPNYFYPANSEQAIDRPKPGEVNYEMRLMAYARAERFRGGW